MRNLWTTYWLSAAITPKQTQSSSFDAGSFIVDGVTYNANDGSMSYGAPPLDAAMLEGLDVGGSLGDHGIYDTYFIELGFNFDINNTATSYNTGDEEGGSLSDRTSTAFGDIFDTTGTDMFYQAFAFDLTGLAAGYELHFDLYSTKIKEFKKGDVVSKDDFAPFSHDGQTRRVPEPASLLLLGLGLMMFGALKVRFPNRSFL